MRRALSLHALLTIYRQCVAGGGGVLSCVGDHIFLQEFNTLVFDQIQKLQNCLTTPKQKPMWGGGPRQINDIWFGIVFYLSNLSTTRASAED